MRDPLDSHGLRMQKGILTIVTLCLVCAAGCWGEDTCDCGPRHFEPGVVATAPINPGAWVELVADHDPEYHGTAKLTFRYDFRLSSELCDTLTLIARGYFDPSSPGVFEYVSGESSWVDTVGCFERREHSVEIRAFRKGQLLIQAYVGAPVDSLWSVGGNELICLCVK